MAVYTVQEPVRKCSELYHGNCLDGGVAYMIESSTDGRES